MGNHQLGIDLEFITKKTDNNVHDDHAPNVARRMYQPLESTFVRFIFIA